MTHTYDNSDGIEGLRMSPSITHKDADNERDATESNEREVVSVVPRAPISPNAAVVAIGWASGPQLTFRDFLFDPECCRFCREMFGEQASSVATMLAEFRLGTDFDYFGPCGARPGRNAGRLDKLDPLTRKTLKGFARKAYLGDREKRGVTYWARIATEIWNAYAFLMAMREQNARITAQDEHRRMTLPQRRAKAAERAKRYRDRCRSKSATKAANEEQPVAWTASSEACIKLEGDR